MNTIYKFTFKKMLLHLKTILIHKWWVLYYAIMCGIPWQGITHDMSKFSPTEFFTNVKYTEKGISPITIQKNEIGFSIPWQHHKGHNPHHYEFWMDRFDEGGYVCRMPFKYTVEMLCDYLAANKAYNGKNATYSSQYDWWQKQRSIRKMHPDNIQFLDCLFMALKECEQTNHTVKYILNKEYLKVFYNVIVYNSEYKKVVSINDVV